MNKVLKMAIIVCIIIGLVMGCYFTWSFYNYKKICKNPDEIGNLGEGYHKRWGNLYKYELINNDPCIFDGVELTGIDIETFEIIDRQYFRDKNGVYIFHIYPELIFTKLDEDMKNNE
ncbi:DKNYY domain-containing protein [Patescibacteria group bacterium]|nr:DKNYY domain-containing protein [Patescibacteria group bacterium]MBU1721395.1 DKNYY domain-containing protein [Patescibacteria group bacterium]MBU1901835.1 DKNYY domain-containing protein [Patescibacteria group bacterium]